LLGSCFLSIYVTIIVHLFNYAFYVTRCMDHVFRDAFKWLYKYGTCVARARLLVAKAGDPEPLAPFFSFFRSLFHMLFFDPLLAGVLHTLIIGHTNSGCLY
jgi:hypothetical protein